MSHRTVPPVAIIGAGPYGISIAAHLKAAGVDFRVFGKPMHRWRCQMPKGMFLKSEGRASNLSDPHAAYTLARYCAEQGLPYQGTAWPVPLETFTQYALWFQAHFAPNLEDVIVNGIDRSSDGFELHLSDGTTMRTDRVALATGLEHAAHVPPELARLPRELVSHSSDHYDLNRFQGKEVLVIGGGQSALETAALAAEQGASVRLLVRKPSLVWNRVPSPLDRSAYQRLRHPRSHLGEGLALWFYSEAPMLFRHLPRRTRFHRARTALGPAGAWWLKDRVIGHVEVLPHHCISAAKTKGGRALLDVVGPHGRLSHIPSDHVICATGYRFDLQRLVLLSQILKSQIHAVEQQPVLSSAFESSVRGLYFTGLASASCFGPAMRFLHGAGYTARCIASHIAARRPHADPVVSPVADTRSYHASHAQD